MCGEKNLSIYGIKILLTWFHVKWFTHGVRGFERADSTDRAGAQQIYRFVPLWRRSLPTNKVGWNVHLLTVVTLPLHAHDLPGGSGTTRLVAVVALFSLPRILGECSTVYSPPALFFFFFKVEISWRTVIPLFMPGSVHRGWTSWDDCGRLFPDKLRVSSFLDRLPHHAWTAASPLRLLRVKGVCVFRCNLSPALWA